MASQNLMKLAAELASEFTVYVPDRRGRGLSLPAGEDYGLAQAVEDLQALVERVDGARVFGLSVGAIISLYAALATPGISKVAAYEPPFSLTSVPGSSPSGWLPRYERELARGQLAAALVTASRGIKASRVFAALPRLVTESLMHFALPAEARKATGDDVALQNLIPTLRHDARIVLDTADGLSALSRLPADVLLLGGSRSAAYFKEILDSTQKVLPHVTRVELRGLGHNSADNGGKPARIARELRAFFQK